MNITNQIIAYEVGELNEMDSLELFSELIKSGMAWTLQGHYGRTASELINGGYLAKDGELLREFEEEDDAPMCANCGESEVEVEGQPCSQRCRDEYIADWLTEKE
jgi:hypothetical protein